MKVIVLHSIPEVTSMISSPVMVAGTTLHVTQLAIAVHGLGACECECKAADAGLTRQREWEVWRE